MRILTYLLFSISLAPCFSQCTLRDEPTGKSTWVTLPVKGREPIGVSIKRDEQGWLLSPQFTFDSVRYVMKQGYSFMQVSVPVSGRFVDALINTPLQSLVVYEHGNANTLDVSSGSHTLGDACKCIREAFDKELPDLRYPIPAAASEVNGNLDVIAGTLIATGARRVNTGTIGAVIAFGAATFLAISDAPVPAAVVGTAGLVFGVTFSISGHSRIARGGDRLRDKGF